MIGLVDTGGNGAANISRSLVTKPVVENVTMRGITLTVVANG